MNSGSSSVWSDRTALAQVTTPIGTGYVAYALDYHGFVVQRRYRGEGKVSRTPNFSTPAWCEPLFEEYEAAVQTLTPVLHPASVLAAGLDYAYLARQAQLLSLDMLTHPTYSGLCLRWGENAYGYHVFAALVPSGTARGAQTPFTDWASGTTYYRHAITIPPSSPPLETLSDLSHQVWLEPGIGGGPIGWYATNQAIIAEMITRAGEPFTLQQCESVYRVELTLEEKGPAEVWDFPTLEAAYAWYTYLEGAPAPQLLGQSYPRLTLATTERLNGQIMTDGLCNECYLPADALHRLSSIPAIPIAPVPIPVACLSEVERPCWSRVPTVRYILKSLQLPDEQVVSHLKLSTEGLHRRLAEPGLWTLAELERLANMAGLSMTTLTALIARELNWGPCTPLDKVPDWGSFHRG